MTPAPKTSGKTSEKALKITLTRSLIGRDQRQVRVANALGLKKLNDTVERAGSPTILGMVGKISHLLLVEIR